LPHHSSIARLARVIALDTPHHVTQRGNARQAIFASDADRAVYLNLLSHYGPLHGLLLAGYCLMSNHVHLIAVPQRPQSLPLALKETHGRYAAYCNVRNRSSGHVWQGRYYSCPLDRPHFWAALRYVERNLVRAGLVAAPEDYAWSSAAVHCGDGCDNGLLDLTLWGQTWGGSGDSLQHAHGPAHGNTRVRPGLGKGAEAPARSIAGRRSAEGKAGCTAGAVGVRELLTRIVPSVPRFPQRLQRARCENVVRIPQSLSSRHRKVPLFSSSEKQIHPYVEKLR
jgi:putative transposase